MPFLPVGFALWLVTSLAAQDPPAPPAPEPVATKPAVGSPAPAFRLNDATGTATAVGGEAKNWTVLAFYPKASTPG